MFQAAPGAKMNQNQCDRVWEEQRDILQAVLVLEKLLPDLLAQTEWIGFAKGVRSNT